MSACLTQEGMTHVGLIVVVDDEPDIREIVAEGLELTGYIVLQAATAEAALELVRTHADVRLVVTDVRLPGMSGVELAGQLQAMGRDIRTILMSGYFSPRPVALKLLRKPFSISELEAAVAAELAR